MKDPGMGQSHLGAVAGAIVGAIGGLFALGTAPAILGHDPTLLFATPILNLASWIVSGLGGWFLGGQIGPLLGKLFKSIKAEAVGGALGGLVPVLLIALWGWHMARR
jgi:hypothetical protein